MAKHHHEKQDTPLPAPAQALLKTLIEEKDRLKWSVDELQHSGPRHKQVYSGLLLSRMHGLLETIEQHTKSRFTPQPGEKLESQKEETAVPVALPFTVADKKQFPEVAEAVSHSPAHEILAFNALLQSIEWSISALAGKSNPV